MRFTLSAAFVLALAFGALALGLTAPAAASVGHAGPMLQATPFLTPTPGTDGWIVYTVQPGDTLYDIAAIAGISVEQLMALNGIQPSDYINPGQRLRLGQGGPVVPTVAPGTEPTATSVPPSPTPVYGTGEICVLLFLDQNGDARWQVGEPPLAGGQLSVADVGGAVVGEHATDGTTEYTPAPDNTPIGHCFTDLPNGDYNVSAAVPSGHNPTTSMNLPIRLEPGDIKYVEFGAQPNGSLGGGEGGGGRSTLLGILGLLLLVAAGGLGYFAARYGRGKGSRLH